MATKLPSYLQPQKNQAPKKNVTYGNYDWDYEGYKKEKDNYKKPISSLSSLPTASPALVKSNIEYRDFRNNELKQSELKKSAPIPSYLQQVSKGDKQLNLNTLTKSKAPNWQKALLSPLATVGTVGNWVNGDLQKDNGKTTGSKFLGRTLDQARSAYTGGAVIRTTNKGNATAPMETGSKVGNFAGDILGMGLGFGANNSFLGTSQGNALNKAIGQPVENALTKGATKLGLNGSLSKIGIAGLKTGTEFGGLNAMSSIAQGKNTKETLKSVREGFVSGALFGAGGKALGEIGKNIKARPQNIQNAFASKFGELPSIDNSKVLNPKGNLKAKIEPPQIKTTSPSISNANGKLKPLNQLGEILPQGNANLPKTSQLTPSKVLKSRSDMVSANMNMVDDVATKTPEGATISGKPETVSKVYSNTLQNTDLLTQIEKDMLKPRDFSYDVKSERMSVNEAKNRIAKDINGEINKLNGKELYSGSDVDTMMGILGDKYLVEARNTGDYTKVQDWLKNVRKAGTEGGRTVQAFSKYSGTKEGKLIEAQRVVDAVEEGLKKNNPRLIGEIDKQAKTVIDTIDTARGNASKQALKELLPEDLLARKVSGTLKTTVRKNDPVTDMVNELFKSAKESPLPGKEKTLPRNPIDYLRQAIENKNEYADVWVKSKDILKAKYADNPQNLAILDDYFNKGIIPTYSENTLNRSVQTTMKELEKKLVDIAKSSSGDKEKALNEITDYLTNNTNATGDDAVLLASKIQSRFNEIVDEKSNSILTNMFKDKPKAKQKNVLEKVQELINLKAYDKESIRDLIKQKEGLPILDSRDIKDITKYMDEATKYAEGSYENRMNMAKVGKIIAEKIPSTGQEKFQAAQRISMLLNPKTTVVRNPLGNALLNSVESAKNVIAAPLDAAVSKIRGSERTTLLAPFTKGKAAAKGFKTGVQEWRKDIINSVDTSPVGGGVELPNKVKIFNENAGNAVQRTINKSANKIHFVVGKALKLGDTPFYNAAYNERLAELSKIKGTNVITDAMKEDAMMYGLERTLQNDSSLSKLFTGLKRADFLKDNTGAKTVYQTFANLILPFAKTPANVLDKFIDYSPAGILKATSQVLSSAGKGTFNQKKFVDTMARGLTGTGLAALGYLMAEKDLITGARNKNNKVAGFEQSLGKSNYAFKVGDTYQTVDWALPAAAPIMMGADIYKSMKNSKNTGEALANGVGSGVNLIFNSTLLQGPSRLLGGYNPAASLASGLLGTTTQATPTIGKQISQLADPYVRETYDPNPLKQTLNKTINRIPFASKTLPKKVDTTGNEVKAFQGKNTIFNVMLNPGFKTTYKPTDVQKEIIRLYEDSGETGQIPAIASKVINKTKTNPQINLTGKEMTEYQKMIGINTLNSYNVIISSSGYKNATDEEKAKLLANALEKAKKNATKEILKEKGKYWGVD